MKLVFVLILIVSLLVAAYVRSIILYVVENDYYYGDYRLTSSITYVANVA